MSCLSCKLPVAACCRAGLVIPVTPEDVVRSQAILMAGALPLRKDGSCAFLSADESCSIYEVRPQACRDQDPRVCERGGMGFRG